MKSFSSQIWCQWKENFFCSLRMKFLFWLPDYISTYGKPNFPLTSSIYLVFLPLEMQIKLKQTKVYQTFFYFVRKEMTHKPLKVVPAKTLFSNVYVVGTICFDKCFLLCDNWKTLLFTIVYRYSEIFSTAMHYCCFP